MAALFNLQEREKNKIQMLEAGFELVKEHGMTHTSVEKVTKAIGIGKGTFYQYFPTKEIFIYEIIVYQREQMKLKFNQLLAGREKIPVEESKQYIMELMAPGQSIVAYLTTDDINKLRAVLPEEYFFSPEKDITTLQTLLSHIEGVSKELDFKVVANLIKIIGIAAESKDLLHKEAFGMTLQMLKSLLLNYIFGESATY
jgi:AcrR family transcriptional regulator